MLGKETGKPGPEEDGDTDAVRESRSIIFYAWAGLAVQSVLTAAVIAFVLAGAAYQRSAIGQLRGKVQAIQVVNLAMVADFLDAQRAITGYQATGAPLSCNSLVRSG